MSNFFRHFVQYVLPNSQNFGCNLYTDSDLFNSGQQVLNGCGGEFNIDRRTVVPFDSCVDSTNHPFTTNYSQELLTLLQLYSKFQRFVGSQEKNRRKSAN